MGTNLPNWILDRLCCPRCASRLTLEDTSLICARCGAVYPIVDGIPDLFSDLGVPKLQMYEDPHYLAWRDMLADSQDYFYQNPGVAFVQNAGHRRIAAWLRRHPASDILDLGCGDGAHLPFVADRNRYLGVDMDHKSLVKLSGRFPSTTVLQANCFRLPFTSASFPCLINIYNLEHLVFLDLALEEMSRILAPGGVVLVSVPSVDTVAVKLARRISSSRHFNRPDFDYDRASELEHVNAIWQLEKAFSRHFRLVERFLFPFRVPILSASLIATYVLVPR